VNFSLNGSMITFTRALGQGTSAAVYQATYEAAIASTALPLAVPAAAASSTAVATVPAASVAEQEVVVKVYKDEAARITEKDMLQLLAGCGVPRLIEGEQAPYLIETPVGRPFVTSPLQIFTCVVTPVLDPMTPIAPQAVYFCQLVDILEQCHKKGVVHRDISFRNIFLDNTNDKLFLNDWGFSSKTNEEVNFRGNIKFAPDLLLQLDCQTLFAQYSPQPWHDLETVVKLAYAAQHPQRWPPAEDSGALLAFWTKQLKLTPWPTLIKAARLSDYNELKKRLTECVM